MNSKIIVALIVIAIIAIGGFFYPQSIKTIERVVESLGADAGPDSVNPYYSVNGFMRIPDRKGMVTSTTTIYAINPNTVASGTTTLSFASCQFTVSSSTASTVTFAKATSAYATTTVIATSSIAANGQATLVAATTTPVADSANGRATITDRRFGPSDYLVVSMEGGAGTFSPTGFCESEFIKN